ncbi:hypothetical protein [Caballeronia sp. TF1N1]|uniref:hypothetical protein n=1 Tax=Caballeronia sp. TF1N1 TaxID=2878153 RepID=UPI001FD4713C|nr:hypothetical protein [Caballeronia sp. TF1N1]
MSQGKELESSGGRVNYYLAQVDHPQREDQPPYRAECEDIIDALGMTFDEGNIFRELWRSANERTHGKGKVGNTPLRAAQKCVHYSGRLLKKAQRAATVSDTEIIEMAKPGPNDPYGECGWRNHDGHRVAPPGLWAEDRVDAVYHNNVELFNTRAVKVNWHQVKRWRHTPKPD